MGLLKSTMISAGKWCALYFVMNKLILYILTTTTFVFANCPNYTAAMKTVEKHLSHKSTHDLELNVSCNEKSLIYANFKIVFKQDNQLIPLSFELHETLIKEQGPWHEVPYLKAADGTGSLRRRDAFKPFEAS